MSKRKTTIYNKFDSAVYITTLVFAVIIICVSIILILTNSVKNSEEYGIETEVVKYKIELKE